VLLQPSAAKVSSLNIFVEYSRQVAVKDQRNKAAVEGLRLQYYTQYSGADPPTLLNVFFISFFSVPSRFLSLQVGFGAPKSTTRSTSRMN